MWIVRFYGGMLQETLKFLLGLNNTTIGLIICWIVLICYLVGLHDAAIFFGGVATTLLGVKGTDHTNTTYAPNATKVNNTISPEKESSNA